MGHLRYADAGVDIDEGNRAVSLIRRSVASTHTPQVVGGIGGFGAMYALDTERFRHPVLVSSTDSVGTKVKIAIATGRHRQIGHDLVNHCVNDILCCGAEPLFFLDYYAAGRLNADQMAEIVAGLADACRATQMALIGGETAEMPGLYALADYDIAGFIVGAVERDAVIDGHEITAGDRLVGLPSSGLHTNGYSLVRRVVADLGLEWGDVLPGTHAPLDQLLLEPHRCYLDAVRELRRHSRILGLAHITGGGLIENVPRMLPDGLAGVIRRSAWEVPPLFVALEREGHIDADEMWRTFNMGLGLVVALPAGADVPAVVADLPVIDIGRVATATGERVVLE